MTVRDADSVKRQVPVLTAGHTPGHTVYHLPEQGVIVSGDALVTGHPTSRTVGPQLLVRRFDDDREMTVSALDIIGGRDGDVLLPGHGEVHRGPVAKAARVAQERARNVGVP